jgi:hypothetical protein
VQSAQSITFDVKAFNFLEKDGYSGEEHYEVFGSQPLRQRPWAGV